MRLSKDGSTGLLIIDEQYQDAPDRGFNLAIERISPGATQYFVERNEGVVIPTIRRLLEYFRDNELPVIHIIMGSEHRDYRDIPLRWREFTRYYEVASGVPDLLWTGNPDFEIRRELAPTPDESVIVKRTWGAFNSTHIDQLLREMNIRSLVITGIYTSFCVETTARDAADRGYGCVLVEDGTADYDAESERASFRAFYLTHGRVVKAAEDIIAAMDGDRSV